MAVGLVLIPFGKVLISTLFSLRDAVLELTLLVKGTDSSTGLLVDVAALKKESLKHRDRLIEIGTELGMKQVERS